ncbi:hypothetical protein RJ40_00735 [Methanofollis aquaemaris]|uniref:Uncharacterized protein n=1 Tax=Methanofollis aquaemaris TaxID=126734 RepID=A0A8A3S2J6_9EURY|nr:hypothetical protein [Methanofollis aquaemaris]QSZ66129.1 hypothetical protein RJ40_00735 [Methanofollis aquaemaris]
MKRSSFSLIVAVVLGLFLLTAGCLQAQSGTITPVTDAATPSPEVTSPSTPDIVGVWTGTTTGYTTAAGFRESNTSYTITAQKGPAFTGSKVYTRWDGLEYSENLSGVISSAGEISIVEHDDGYTFGTFIGPDEIELRHLQDGDNAMAFIVRLSRDKN